MSSCDVVINKFNHFHYDNKYTLLSCNLKVSTIGKEPIIVPGKIDSDIHLVLDSECEVNLRSEVEKYPIKSEYEITTYDCSANVTSKLLKGRTNNKFGTIVNEIRAYNLLSEISLPNIESGTLVFMLNSYPALEEIILDERKKQFLELDFERFSKNNKTALDKGVVLIISKNIWDKLSCTSSNNINVIKNWLEESFSEIYINSDINSAFLEGYFGKILSPSKINYQKHIKFGEDLEIVSCMFDDSKRMSGKIIGRGDGFIKINTFDKDSEFDFVCLVKNKASNSSSNSGIEMIFDDQKIVSSDIENEFKDNENEKALKIFDIFRNNVLYLNALSKGIKKRKFSEFISDSSLETIKYMFAFNKEIFSSNDFEQKSEIEMIKKFSIRLERNIKDTLLKNMDRRPSFYEFNSELPEDYDMSRAVLGRQRTNY